MDFISDYLTLEYILYAVGLILLLVAGKTGLDFISEIKDVVDAWRRASSPSSPGGKGVTKEEFEEIKTEALEALRAIWDKYGSGITGFVGRILLKLKFW